MNILDTEKEKHFYGHQGGQSMHRHSFGGCIMSTGVLDVCDTLECHWLADVVFSHGLEQWRRSYFMTCDFITPVEGEGIFIMSDGNLGEEVLPKLYVKPAIEIAKHENILAVQKVDFTDLYIKPPVDKLRFYCIEENQRLICILPNEY